MDKIIYTKEHKNLIKLLKKARKEAGLDQEDVASFLGKTQSYVSKIEAGQRRIDIIQLRQFAKLYKKPINYFLS